MNLEPARIATTAQRLRIAIVHDYLTQRGGAERVVLAMARAFPGAPILTALYEPESTYPDFRGNIVIPSILQNVPPLRHNHRRGLPFYAPLFSSMHVKADLVLCSTSGWAHGISTDGSRVLYVHNTARWLYQSSEYVRPLGIGARATMRTLSPSLRRWDRKRGVSADAVLVNSRAVQERVWQAWGVRAEILYPPHGVDLAAPREPITELEEGFLLVVARLLSYKNVDVVLEAMRALPGYRLAVVGSGPEEARLRHLAPTNVIFLGEVSDAKLRWLYSHCSGLISAAHDDLGLAPLEAMAFGRPVAVLRAGGYLDTVIDGMSGIFFEEPRPDSVANAVRILLSHEWDASKLRGHASNFDEAQFTQGLHTAIGRVFR